MIAAGGIADGRGVAAALILGADGVWLGSRFVASVEANPTEWIKRRVVSASGDDTVLTRSYDLATRAPFPDGIADRVLRNTLTNRWHGLNAEVIAQRGRLSAELDQARERADQEVVAVRVGSGAGLIHAIEPAADIVRNIMHEAEGILRNRSGQLLAAGG